MLYNFRKFIISQNFPEILENPEIAYIPKAVRAFFECAVELAWKKAVKNLGFSKAWFAGNGIYAKSELQNK